MCNARTVPLYTEMECGLAKVHTSTTCLILEVECYTHIAKTFYIWLKFDF